ncbi:MAG: SAM-dependent methyltransferase [Flavobacteriales bacterium]|nr:SAM-dependent methyltransferase [Flavobacteriales bacterium]MBK7941577.1 SAM-dependent methyltransferase [Flavobacteriales bacterium]MBK8949399.1 SAM-dependent methyltransferase [Flavobacteriales bacterium]MBK9700122.1 SAM-dependent methyltransferase [Flavobacteriales bacterium]
MGAEAILHLIPVWLGEAGGPEQLAPMSLDTVARVRLFFVEHERSARRALRRMDPVFALGQVTMHVLDKDTDEATVRRYAELVHQAGEATLLSESGMPCVADPGARLVAWAHRMNIEVRPHPGPSSLLLALAGSGLDGQHFTFHGYLPREAEERRRALRTIAQDAQRTGRTQLFIETPYRNDALLADLLRTVDGALRLCIAAELMQPTGFIRTRTVSEWRSDAPVLKDRRTVFVLGR